MYNNLCMELHADVKEMEVIKEDETRTYAWLEERNDQFVVLGGTYDGPKIQR